MPNITPIQTSFSSGEISPKLLGRVDSKGYGAGLSVMLNMWADTRGPAIRRSGTRYTSQVEGNDGRIMAMPTSERSGYLITLTDLEMTPVAISGVPALATNLVENYNFRDSDTGWTVLGTDVQCTATFNPDNLVLDTGNGNNDFIRVSQQITVVSDTYSISAPVAVLGGPTTLRIGTTDGGDEIFSTPLVVGLNNFEVPLTAGDVWVSVELTGKDNVSELSSINMILTTDGGSFVTPWPESALEIVHIIPSPGGDTVYFTHPNYPMQKLVYDYATDTLTFEAVTFTSPPANWVDSNHPRTGVFHEGRLWLGGTPDLPQTFWGSKSNVYEDFTLGSLADDALQFTMAKIGNIRWMASTKNLLVGTSRGEHIVTSVEGIITPGDIQVTQQSAYGSNNSQPRQVGDQIFYVSSDGRKLRAMQYEWAADNWLSNDVTFLSEHLTAVGIRQVSWAQNPYNQFYCVLNNGKMAVLTYERGEKIYGWYQYDVGGQVKDVTSIPIGGTDVEVVLVQRVDGSLYIELIPLFVEAYVDSFVQQVVDPPQVVFSGFGHLEGMELQVLADGAVHPVVTVTGGEITLNYPVSKVIAGLAFSAKIRTLPIDPGTQSGSAQPYEKSYYKLLVTLLGSANPLINGIRQPSRTPSTPMDTPEPYKTGRSEISQLGWDKNAQVTIEQDLPLALTVVSLSGELAMRKL